MTSKGALLVATLGTALVMSGSAYAGSCSRLSISSTAVTHELATALAKGFLSDEIALRGAKGKSPVRVACKYDLIVSTCTASEKICK
jgi:hypothetical protein